MHTSRSNVQIVDTKQLDAHWTVFRDFVVFVGITVWSNQDNHSFHLLDPRQGCSKAAYFLLVVHPALQSGMAYDIQVHSL